MKSSLVLAATTALAFAVPASAAVLDFNSFASGVAINSISSDDGTVTATVTTTGGIGQALTFDTGLTGTDDPDLEAPFTLFSDPTAPTVNPGNVLIIQTDAGNPDDDADGGTIRFDFDTAVNFTSFRIFDGAAIDVSSTSGGFFAGFVPEPTVGGSNLYGQFDVSGLFDNIFDLTFTFKGSGAIDDLNVTAVPVPAALPLLLGAFGALGYVGRRRRKAAHG